MAGEAKYEPSQFTASRLPLLLGLVLQNIAVCQASTKQLRCLDPIMQKGVHGGSEAD